MVCQDVSLGSGTKRNEERPAEYIPDVAKQKAVPGIDCKHQGNVHEGGP